MIKNYFKTAIRNIAKYKMFSLLNIIGLAIGMSVTLLVIILLENVWRFDSLQPNKDYIYRISTEATTQNGKTLWATTFPQLANELSDTKTIDEIVKISKDFGGLVSYKTKEVNLKGYLADPHFFSVFQYEFISGNPLKVLEFPYSVVLTEQSAKKIFGDASAYGKRISTRYGDFTVSGVIKEPAGNSHFSFDMIGSYATLISMENAGRFYSAGWDWHKVQADYIYLLIKSDNITPVLNQLKTIAARINMQNKDVSLAFSLQDLHEIILGPQVNRPIGSSYPLLDTLIFISLTLLILVPACFNYINLSIARSINRGKEIGVRKIAGASRQHIILQFLTETIVISLIALIGSLVIVFFIKDEFILMLAPASRLTHIEISVVGYFWAIALAFITGILAGLIPALYFSKLQPLQSIKSRFNPASFGTLGFRKVLIIFQFALSVGFLIGISAIAKQYYHALNFDTGFNKDNILIIPLQDVKYTIFKQEFSYLPEIHDITFASQVPGFYITSETTVGAINSPDSLKAREIFVDENFIKCLGINLLRGNDFSPAMSQSEETVIVNSQFEKAAHANKIRCDRMITQNGTMLSVIGVVDNFNMSPMQKDVDPVIIRLDPDRLNYACVNIKPGSYSEIRIRFEAAWKRLSNEPFKSEYLRYYVEDAFKSYKIMLKVLGFQGLLVLLISCLGLLGMVTYTTENRVKEISMRKILGASEKTLIWLMSKGFVRLLLIATLIGIPISYLLFNMTLSQTQNNYTGIGFTEISASLFTLFLLGGLSIYWQVKKVASTNPVENLRNE